MASHTVRLIFALVHPFLALGMDCSGKQTASDMVQGLDLSEKTFVITGGDGGLGYENALALAKTQARVVLACRSHTKCPAAASRIISQTGNKNIQVIPLDLSSFDSVRTCGAAIRKQVSRIDALINNAGLLVNPKGLPAKTDDGFDRVYQVNFLAAHLLVQELLPLLRSSGARVINVASTAHNFPCLWGRYMEGCTSLNRLPDFAQRSPAGFNFIGSQASNYGMTKYLDVFYAAELAHREPNITAYSLHPGVVSTDMTGGLSPLVLQAWCLVDFQHPCPRTVEEGASTQTYVAVAPKEDLASANGRYFESCKPHVSQRDLYATTHGRKAAESYQSGIYEMASKLINGGDRKSVLV